VKLLFTSDASQNNVFAKIKMSKSNLLNRSSPHIMILKLITFAKRLLDTVKAMFL